MSTPPSLADIMSQILNAVQTVIYQVASALAENASVIATVIVLGGLTYAIVRYGRRIFSGFTSFLRGLF